jgi:hypothetical protein
LVETEKKVAVQTDLKGVEPIKRQSINLLQLSQYKRKASVFYVTKITEQSVLLKKMSSTAIIIHQTI